MTPISQGLYFLSMLFDQMTLDGIIFYHCTLFFSVYKLLRYYLSRTQQLQKQILYLKTLSKV